MLKSDIDIGEYNDNIIIESDEEEDNIEIIKDTEHFKLIKSSSMMDVS
jgi:hypothetical protein